MKSQRKNVSVLVNIRQNFKLMKKVLLEHDWCFNKIK